MELIKNPMVLGTIVFALVWFVRKLGWSVEGLKALWLTMIVAILIAVAERLLSVGPPNFLICEMVSEPVSSLSCLLGILESVVKEAGIIFAATELIYQVLRREVAGRSILGDRI